MTAPVVLSRADWGADPVVRSSDGTPRPLVESPALWLTVHYTGNSSPLTTDTMAAVIAAQQGLERFAAGAGKPNEYNYCLYNDAAGTPYVVEYAGPYRAAHSADENAQAIGVLFWIGVGQAVPDPMITAYRYLRDRLLTPMGIIGAATAQTPHRDMPGAATPCPGPVLNRWDQLLAPYSDDGGGPPMANEIILVRNGDDPTGAQDVNWNGYVCFAGGKYWIPTNDALAIRTAELGPPIDVSDEWMRAHGPVVGPNPGKDDWGAWSRSP